MFLLSLSPSLRERLYGGLLPPPPEAQYGDLGSQGDCAHGAAQGDPEALLTHLPRTGVKSPGLSALLGAKGLMEGRTMRAKESSRTCQRRGGVTPSLHHPREHSHLMGRETEAQKTRLCFNWGWGHATHTFPPPTGRSPKAEHPFILGAIKAEAGLTAMQVPAWADLLVDWTTMACSFFSCSKRDLNAMSNLG